MAITLPAALAPAAPHRIFAAMFSYYSDPVSGVDYRTPRAIHVAGASIRSAEPADRWRLFVDNRELDFGGPIHVFPGFVDTHCHLIGWGLMASRVRLYSAVSARECAELMAARARERGKGEWIVGFGWNQERWAGAAMPDRALLDELVPDNPAVLIRIDSHASWCNTRALEAAGITGARAREIEPAGGAIVLAADGTPTGLLVDHAMKLVEAAMPEPSVQEKMAWIAESARVFARIGITEVHDMNVEPARLEAMTRVAEGGDLLVRCRVFVEGAREAWRSVGAPAVLAEHLDIVGVKFFADGALGSRGALLAEPYADAPGRGLALMSAEELIDAAAEPIERGFAVATHAIGDEANRVVLDAYTELRRRYPSALLRIEHAQIVQRRDMMRMRDLGVIPAMQAVHCTSDAAMAEQRLGLQRCADAYAWRSLRDLGLPILGGSDSPIETPSVRAGLRAFHERIPEGTGTPWFREQRLTRAEALDAYTAWAQLGVPNPARRGALLPGFQADLAVTLGDPFEPHCIEVATLRDGELTLLWQ